MQEKGNHPDLKDNGPVYHSFGRPDTPVLTEMKPKPKKQEESGNPALPKLPSVADRRKAIEDAGAADAARYRKGEIVYPRKNPDEDSGGTPPKKSETGGGEEYPF